MKSIALALLLCLGAIPTVAQQTRPLTDEAAEAITAFYNRPGTTRASGETRIAPGSRVTGDMAVLGGPFRVEGIVDGDVVVINGDLELSPGARITGAATVVGGLVTGAEGLVDGSVVVYTGALTFRREGGMIRVVPDADRPWLGARRPTWFGTAEFRLSVDGSYNRVEGLPIGFGPRLEAGRTNPTVLEARLIYRTQSGLRIHPDELGHDVRLQQYAGGHRATRFGIGRHRIIRPIESRGLSETENSLATFLLHRDYHDHYQRRGWSAFVAHSARTRPLELGVEYRDESHGSLRSETPWSLLDNDEEWRPQPQVAEGEIQSVRGWFRLDSRNDPVDPATGWLLHVEAEQGLEGNLRVLGEDGAPPGLVDVPVRAEFSALSVDLRRYFRLGPRTRLSLRGMAAGSPDDGALPPQRQHVLGGEGSLPGYDRFAFDCGARDAAPIDGFLPYYGCDRSVLLQGELRFSILADRNLSLGRRLGLDFDLLTTPELVVFGDAGRAWIEEESQAGRLELGTAGFRYDAGIGLRVGRLGIYIAWPLIEGRGGNVFVRLGPRL